MQVRITIEVDGRAVKEHAETMEGTLEEMEERVTALGRRVACDALQATVDAVSVPRPPFAWKVRGVTRGTRPARSSV